MVNIVSRAADVQHMFQEWLSCTFWQRSGNTTDQGFAKFRFGSWHGHTVFLKNTNSLDNMLYYGLIGPFVFSLMERTVDFKSLKHAHLCPIQALCNVCNTNRSVLTQISPKLMGHYGQLLSYFGSSLAHSLYNVTPTKVFISSITGICKHFCGRLTSRIHVSAARAEIYTGLSKLCQSVKKWMN